MRVEMALVAYLVMVFGLVLLVTQGADDDSFLFQNKNTSFPTDIVLGTAAAAAAASALVYEEGAYIWDTYTRKHSVNEGAEHPFVFNRNLFPRNFMFGTGSAAYQYEGAYNEDGKGPSIWDTYTHKHPERITDGSNGDVADDHYHRYKEDITLMKDIGLEAYRFSISWPRVLPNGNLSGGVNKKGIKFYNNLINEVLSKGLHPYVTLFHWDVPQGLEDEYGGFLNSRIVQDFKDYADLCFKEFGDRVKYWITLNEPRTFSHRGYDVGTFAPGRCSKYMGNCTSGDSGREPYIVSHYQILAHAAAVKVYREKYQAHQNGKIGITLNCHWMVPISNAGYQRDAAKRAIDFIFGWFMHPLTYGYYPKSMRALVKRRLPKFSEEQSNDVRGSYDFLGLNYYTGFYARYSHSFDPCQPSYHTDSRVSYSSERDNKTIGPPAASSWLHLYPSGLRKLLHYIRRQYKNPTIYITENGVDEFNNSTLSLMEALTDNMRITYFDQHLKFLLRAINEGVDVRGYFFWSFLDNFEWSDGYTVRFGIIYVNYTTLTRSPKHSSIWFRKFLLK